MPERPDTDDPVDESRNQHQIRTILFEDGLLVFNRDDPSQWIQADGAVPLSSMR